MTDNEIIKALECCCVSECDECPYDEQTACVEILKEGTLDLINRQKAEIERLKAENEVMKTNCNSMYVSMPNMAKAERTEAIKEFAERLNKHSVYVDDYDCFMVSTESIDNLVKEMVGEINEI